MSDKGSPDGSADPGAAPETTASSANGTTTKGAQAVADPAPADSAADATPSTDGASPDDGSAFLTELARAMQMTAAAEKARIVEDTGRRREAHLAAIGSRREAEATSMRELADADLKAIDAWADDERKRIQTEREKRAMALQADLTTSLAEHGARIDREIASVETAIAGYRTDVDTFFASLDRETDPVEIARHASQRPAFPSLDAIESAAVSPSDAAASAPADAPAEAETAPASTTPDGTAEPDSSAATAAATESTESTGSSDAPVAVMAPPGSASLAESWAAWSGIPPERAAAESAETVESPAVNAGATASADAAAGEETSAEPVPVEPSAVVSGKGKVLQSVPSTRPMSWLRRDREGGERQNGDR